jgi:hypothetical protein
VDVEALRDQLADEQEISSFSTLFGQFTLTVYDDCLCMQSRPEHRFRLDDPTDTDELVPPDSALDSCVFYFTCGALVMWSVPPAVEMQLVSHFDSYATSTARVQSEDSWLIETRSLRKTTDTFTYSLGQRCVLTRLLLLFPTSSDFRRAWLFTWIHCWLLQASC